MLVGGKSNFPEEAMSQVKILRASEEEMIGGLDLWAEVTVRGVGEVYFMKESVSGECSCDEAVEEDLAETAGGDELVLCGEMCEGREVLAGLPLFNRYFLMVVSNSFDEVLGGYDVDGWSGDVCGGETIRCFVFRDAMMTRGPSENDFTGMLADLDEGLLDLKNNGGRFSRNVPQGRKD